MLRITVSPRLHISLIGMNNDGYRVNGGLGFSISSPVLVVQFEESDSFAIIDESERGLTREENQRLVGIISRVAKIKGLIHKYKAYVNRGFVYSHYGLGATTAIYMACIEALFIINNVSYTPDDVVHYSTRGGTSGIGVNTYFKGGFVLDVGVPSALIEEFKPSSCHIGDHRLPLALCITPLPEWELGICIPELDPKTEEDEKLFFKNHCPIEKKYVEAILYEAVYGVTASVIEHDFDVFCASIDALQKTRWKELERGLYGEELLKADTIIREAGAKCVGMSSLGPLLYFFGEDVQSIIESVGRMLPGAICFKTSFNNSGRVILYD